MPTTPSPFAKIRDTAESEGGFFRETERHCISYVPGDGVLIVSFDNAFGVKVKEDRTPWGFDYITSQGWSILGVMEKEPDWYRHTSLREVFDELCDAGFFKKFRKVVFYGYSMGSYGATAFCTAAPGATVLLYGTRATRHNKTFNGADLPFDTSRYGDVRSGIPDADRVFMFYDPTDETDNLHARIYSGSNVEKFECRHLGHHVANEFAGMSILKPILDGVVSETFTSQQFYALFRNRMTSITYVHKLMCAAIARGHYVLALRIVMIMSDRLEPGRSRWRFRRHRKGLRQAIATGESYDLG